MCGIAGIVTSAEELAKEPILDRMASALAHRGPDSQGVWSSGGVGLAFRRLSVLDLTNAGNQPMRTPDGRYTIVYNGEIYNWLELRGRLKNRCWRSGTDTETLLHAFAELGPECLQLFNGMFGFAIWDAVERRLFLARDRVGIKPLYFGMQDGRFYFASEPKGMFAAGFEKTPDYQTLYEFLRWGLIDHDAKTFFANVRNLTPGHYLTFSPGSEPVEHCYWSLIDNVLEEPKVSPGAAAEQYAALLDDSIRLQSRADVAVGSALSGGVDSSVLTSRMTRRLGRGSPPSFAYEFGASPMGEGPYAAEVADILGLPLTTVRLFADEIPERFREVIRMHEAPITSMRVIAHHKMYEAVLDQGVTVLLEGSGGDELGAGYEYYYVPYVLDTLRRADGADALGVLNHFMDKFKVPEERRTERLLDSLKTVLRPGVSTQDGVSFVAPHCLSMEFLHDHTQAPLQFEGHFDDFLSRMQYIDFRHIVLPRAMRYTDRASMASGREAREPILDHRIVELSFRTEIEARIKDGHQRDFMRKAARGILPEPLLERPKRTIVDPQRTWLKEELRDWVLELLHSPTIRDVGLFRPSEILDEYRRYSAESSPRTSFHLFQFLNVIVWFEEMFGHASVSSADARA